MSGPTDKVNLFLKLFSPSLQTKLLCLTILVLYLTTFKQELVPYLACVPSYIKLPYLRLWTLFTSTFVEFHLIFALVDIFCILASATILEPLWGVTEFFIFLSLIAVVTTAINVSVCFLLSFVISTSPTLVEIYGASGVLCGLAVSLKQVRPDFELSLVPPISFRLKHLPFLYLLITTALGLFEFTPLSSILTSLTSLVISWTYLRFLQRRESNIRGDQTETFEFVTLFPEPLHPCLFRIGSVMAAILRFLRLYPATQRTYDLGVPSEIGLLLPMTVSTSTDRRKQKAQKDLEERLSRTVNKSEEEWPDMLDAESSGEQAPSLREGELENVVVVGETEGGDK